MNLHRLALAALIACAPAAFSQSFEASVSGGESYIPSKSSDIGAADLVSGDYHLKDGFRISLRMTLNSWRFMGHEFGYAYNHTSLDSPATTTTGLLGPITTPVTNTGLPAHQGFYDFLVYAAPEGSHVRPFACGGVQFTSFSQAGSYSRETKYGVNFGGGLKVKVMQNWGFRLDVRQYNMSKPFNNVLINSSGRLQLYEFGVGISFMM
jgi:opacity protein-like surface antigen